MKKRIGVQRQINWSIRTNGTTSPLTGRDLTLYLLTPRNGKVKIEDWKTVGNQVQYVFSAMVQEQYGTGAYGLSLYENKGKDEQSAVDACHFIDLVDCTCKADDEPSDLVNDVIELDTSLLEVLSEGGGGDIPPYIYEQIEDLQRRVATLESTPVPTKVSELENDAEYITGEALQGKAEQSDVDNLATRVSSVETGKQDVIEDLEQIREGANGGFNAVQRDEMRDYAKVSEVNEELDKKANKTEIPTIPTNVSAFTNDAGYLTEHQSLADYATKDELEGKQETIADLDAIRSGASAGATAVQPEALQGYAKVEDIPDVSGKQNAPTNGSTESTTIAIDGTQTSEVVYTYGTIANLVISQIVPSNYETIIKFTSGATATSLTLPSTYEYVGNAPKVEANKSYVISILNGILVFGEVAQTA